MKQDKKVSIVISPSGSYKSHSFVIPSWALKTAAALSGILVVALIIGGVVISKKSSELLNYDNLKTKLAIQEKQLRSVNSKLLDMKKSIQNLTDQEEEIQHMLKTTKIKKKSRRRSKKNAKIFNKSFKNLAEKSPKEEELISFLNTQIKTIQTKLDKHENKIKQHKARFASIPSIYPVYGRILSKYGWRRHPLTGRRKFHKGIDIPSWMGAPIKSTADGKVSYSGWNGTFGNVVVVDHNYGYRTIYAHASRLLVKKGEIVKKGQVIAHVGSTGLSTGAHIHYEVRRWRKAVHPGPYLDLDMFTASTRI